MEIREFYYDWGLQNKSAMFAGICTDLTRIELPVNEEYRGKKELHTEIINLSQESEKEPDEIYSC